MLSVQYREKLLVAFFLLTYLINPLWFINPLWASTSLGERRQEITTIQDTLKNFNGKKQRDNSISHIKSLLNTHPKLISQKVIEKQERFIFFDDFNHIQLFQNVKKKLVRKKLDKDVGRLAFPLVYDSLP